MNYLTSRHRTSLRRFFRSFFKALLWDVNQMPLRRLTNTRHYPGWKKTSKKTSFLENCFVEKVSTLSVCLENKQFTTIEYNTYNEILTQGRTGFDYFDYLLKHKRLCIFEIFNLDFESSTRYLAIYIITVKILFFVYDKVAFTVNISRICYSICCSYAVIS